MDELSKMMDALNNQINQDIQSFEPKNDDDIDLSFLGIEEPKTSTSEFDYITESNPSSATSNPPTSLPAQTDEFSQLINKMKTGLDSLDQDIRSGAVFEPESPQLKQNQQNQLKPQLKPQQNQLKPQLKPQQNQLKPQLKPQQNQLKPQLKPQQNQLKPQLKPHTVPPQPQGVSPQEQMLRMQTQIGTTPKPTATYQSPSSQRPLAAQPQNIKTTSLSQITSQTVTMSHEELSLDALLEEVEGAVISEQSMGALEKDLKELPNWALARLKKEIERRIEIENIWRLENFRIFESQQKLDKYREEIAYKTLRALEERNKIIEDQKKEIQSLKKEIEFLKNNPNMSRRSNTSGTKTKNPVSAPSSPSPRNFKSKDETVIFDSTSTSWMDTQRPSLLTDLLFYPKHELLKALVESTLLDPKLQEEATTSILIIYQEKDQVIPLLSDLISDEVMETVTENTLFRTNSVASKLMTTYTKILGLPYLQKIVAPVLKEISDKNENLEIDPNKATAQENIEENMQKIENYAHKILQTITLGLDSIPLQFRTICSLLHEKICTKFESSISGIRNFIFLRFICPAILLPPMKLGIAIASNTPRTLTLVGKTIQNVVNGVEFKEPFMKNLNEFVKMNNTLILQFMKNLTLPPSPAVQNEKFINPYTSKEAIRRIQTAMSQTKDELLKKLSTFDSRTYTQECTFIASDRLISVCSNLGIPKKGKKFPLIQNDPKTTALAQLVVEEPAICTELATICGKQKEGEKIIQSILYVQCVNSPSHAIAWARSFISESLVNEKEIPADSLAFKVFSNYLNLCGVRFLRDFIPELYQKQLLAEELKPNSDRLAEVSQNLLGDILEHLSALPPATVGLLMSAWEALKSKLSPLQAANEVLKLFCRGYICLALENPDQYQLTEVPKKKGKKALTQIANTISTMCDPTNASTKDPKFLQIIMKQFENSCKTFADWLEQPANLSTTFEPSQLETPTNIWNIEEESLRVIHANLTEQTNAIASKLGETGVKKKVTFRLSSFVSALIAPVQQAPTGKDEKRSQRATSLF